MPETKPKPSALKKGGHGRVLLLAAVAIVAFVLLRRKLAAGSASVPAVVASDPALTALAADPNATSTTDSSGALGQFGAQLDYLGAYADSLSARLSNVETSGAPAGPAGPAGPEGPAGPATPPPTPQPVVHAPVSTPAALTQTQVTSHEEFLTRQVAQTAAGGAHTAGF